MLDRYNYVSTMQDADMLTHRHTHVHAQSVTHTHRFPYPLTLTVTPISEVPREQ